MSAKQDTTVNRITVMQNVKAWRKSHPCHLTQAEAEHRHHVQQRYWIRQGRIVSIAQAWPQSTSVVNTVR